MKAWKRRIIAGAIAAGAACSHAQVSPGDARGELLYTTHCVACHTTQIHWREKRLASDWASLAVQVDRWQKNGNLAWDAADVAAVARHLNAVYYHFPMPEAKALGSHGGPERVARRS